MIKLRIPASTSNLGSAFDTIGLALQLYLTVTVKPAADSQRRIDYSGEGENGIALDESNLVYKSARKVFERAREVMPPLDISIENPIPLARGLGSSGAATVGGLLAANHFLKQPLATDTLLALAIEQEGHPENVSASLLGGLTISCLHATGHVTKRVEIDPALRTVVVIPEERVSTDAARLVLPETVSHKDAIFNVQRSALLSHAFLTRDYSALKEAVQDKLHQPYRKKMLPAYDVFETAAYECGALGVCVSGSGSAIIAFTLGDGKILKNRWQQVISAQNLSAQTRILGLSSRGAELVRPV